MDTRTKDLAVQPAADARRRVRTRKWIGSALGILIAAIIAWFLFAPNPVTVEVTTVTRGPMQVTVNHQGQVRVHDKYIVAAPVAAKLERIALHDGDPVRKDQVVAILNPLPMDEREKEEALARLEAAQALAREASLRTRSAHTDMQFAINERARVERLVESGFVSSQAADKARTAEAISRAAWNAAKSRELAAVADVKMAEAALSAAGTPQDGRKRPLKLSTPVDGYILKVHERSERTIPAGTPLITIGDRMQYEIVVDVLSTDAVKVKPGDTMLLEEWGGGKTLQAKVRVVEPVAFTKISALGVEEQRVNVIADPVDSLGPLGDGYRIEARIVIWSADDVVKVKGSSLFRVGDAWHVFVVENGRAREREVKLGQRNQDEAQIVSGLAVGTRVIRYPSNELEEGARVTPSNASGNQ